MRGHFEYVGAYSFPRGGTLQQLLITLTTLFRITPQKHDFAVFCVKSMWTALSNYFFFCKLYYPLEIAHALRAGGRLRSMVAGHSYWHFPPGLKRYQCICLGLRTGSHTHHHLSGRYPTHLSTYRVYIRCPPYLSYCIFLLFKGSLRGMCWQLHCLACHI